MTQFVSQSLLWAILALLFSLSYAQIRIVSKSYTFEPILVGNLAATTRTESWNLDWKNTDRRLTVDHAFVGISGIDVKTSRVDFALKFVLTSSDEDISLSMKVGPNCAINSIQAFVLSTFDCKFFNSIIYL